MPSRPSSRTDEGLPDGIDAPAGAEGAGPAEPSGGGPRLPGWASRAAGLLDRRPTSPRARRLLILVAMAIFLAVSIPSFSSLQGGQAFRPWILPLLVLVTPPLTVLANAAEYRVMGAVGGHRISWRDSTQLTILAAVANLLPLPGGVVVRTQALRNKGSSYRRALGANLAAGMAWIAAGAFGIGLLLLWQPSRRLAALAFLAGSAVLLVLVWLLLRRANPTLATRHLGRLVAVEAVIVVVAATRLWLAFALIGYTASPAQAVGISSSIIVAAAVGIFPAGLGLREALAGLIAVAVDMPSNRAVAATAADRVAAQLGLALVAGAMALLHRRVPVVPDEVLEEVEGALDDGEGADASDRDEAVDDPPLRPVDLP